MAAPAHSKRKGTEGYSTDLDDTPIVVTAVIGIVEPDINGQHTMVETAFLMAANHLDVSAQNGNEASVEFRHKGYRFFASVDTD